MQFCGTGKGGAVISGLHHYALEVPDLDIAEGFLQDFGLEILPSRRSAPIS
jgi:hypothetical protein